MSQNCEQALKYVNQNLYLQVQLKHYTVSGTKQNKTKQEFCSNRQRALKDQNPRRSLNNNSRNNNPEGLQSPYFNSW